MEQQLPSKTTNSSTGVDNGGAIAPLREAVSEALDQYFQHLNGHDCYGLHQLVMREVEVPLIQAAMAYADGNQTRAAQLLGINRGTLRRKLREYQL